MRKEANAHNERSFIGGSRELAENIYTCESTVRKKNLILQLAKRQIQLLSIVEL